MRSALTAAEAGACSTSRPAVRPCVLRPGNRSDVWPSAATHRSCHRRAILSRSAAAVSAASAQPDVAVSQFPSAAAGAFRADRRSFSEEYRIRGYEVSPDQRANIITVANLLQEVASNHAVGMWGRTDEGFANLPEMKDLLFVMTRLQIRIFEYPKWGDVVCAETYFTDEGRLAFRREWRLTEARSGRLLGVATSTWVTINAAARRLAKLPDDQRNRFLRFAAPNSAAVLPVEETKRKLPDMDLPGKHQAPTQVARRSDMDMNGHINNASYLAWALESVPADVHEHYRLREIEIDFKAECHAGNTVEAHANPLAEDGQPLPPAEAAASGAATNGASANGAAANGSSSSSPEALFLHVLQKCDDSGCAELVRARTTWRRA